MIIGDVAQGRFSLGYMVHGGLQAAHAPGEHGDVMLVSEPYVTAIFEALWRLERARDPSMASWPPFLRDWNLGEGAWAIGADWHGYAAGPTAAAVAGLAAAGLPEAELRLVYAADVEIQPGSLAEAMAALVAFVEAAPGGTIHFYKD